MELYLSYSDGELESENIAPEATWSVTSGSAIASIDGEGVLTMSDDFSSYSASGIRIKAEYEDYSEELEIAIASEDEDDSESSVE